VGPDEIDREEYGLIPIHVDEWQGCLFVNLAEDAPSLRTSLEQNWGTHKFEKWNLGELRTARTSRYEVAANWKILVENYMECLHCPGVHPELVALIPTYRSGAVSDGSGDPGTPLADGARALTASGTSKLPALPGLSPEEASRYYGCYLFPNAMLDLAGPLATLTTIVPQSADRSTVISDYLFAPETIAQPDFDPTDVFEFNELVLSQDNTVCERVQRGIVSRAWKHGVYPEKDSGPHRFDEAYSRVLGPELTAEIDEIGR
jgi:Rieske 2Fe-2S family protein